MSKPDFEQFLNQQLQQQQKEISPERDLWPGIEQGINAHTHTADKSWFKPALGSAAAAILVAVIGLNLPSQQGSQPSNQFAVISDVFEQQKQNLLVQYQAQPALTDNWQQQLQELEQAEQAIKTALEEQPNNRALLNMLAQVYQQQLNLINNVHQPKQGAVLQRI
ncbi:hypothetical protein ABMY44_12685 [Pseudoalteromonas sp. Cnat2-41]|uniref:hypothetical protein n=1 Tax=unclassified Pseudoalteromonas TaxID=194690 RepID=UPI001EF88099|nr:MULTISPECIES: hypothetical protein [unclassified Pseudoalteromonas]MCF2862680.1 hypothetical protein [Pseudoalteromonas sp. CNAT2-18]MCG7558868.1 hypothetical protein [Pseudoalteromonas sp. CNAT2-18.1]